MLAAVTVAQPFQNKDIVQCDDVSPPTCAGIRPLPLDDAG